MALFRCFFSLFCLFHVYEMSEKMKANLDPINKVTLEITTKKDFALNSMITKF